MSFNVGTAVVKKKLLIELRTRLPDPFGDEAEQEQEESKHDRDTEVEEEKQPGGAAAPKVIALPKLELLIRAYLQKVEFDVNRLLSDEELTELLRQEFDMPAQ